MDWELAGLILCTFSGLVLFVSRNWRWNLLSLSLVYPGGFMLLIDHWPVEQSAILLVGGWMGAAVLGATRQADDFQQPARDAGVVFRLLLFSLLLLVAWSASEGAGVWIPGISQEAAMAGILLAGAGMVRTGIVREPLQIVLSLLALIAGFEWVYAFVESSALMTALLAVVNLGLAVTGSYLAAFTDLDEGGAPL